MPTTTQTPARLAVALGLALVLGLAPVALAQSPATDDALDKLLEKAGAADKPKADAKGKAAADRPKSDDALDKLLEKAEAKEKAQAKPADKPKADGAKPKSDDPLDKLLEQAESKEKAKADAAKPQDKPKPPDEPEDKELDKLLQGIGAEPDRPDAEGKASGEAMPPPGQPDDPTAQDFDPKKKQLDARLEELLGRIKKRDQDDQGEQPSGPLGEAIKKMDEVEQKLGQKDTGETTRKEQKQIVDGLDQMIKLARQGRMRGQQRPGQPRPGDPQGPQPGQQQGEQANNTGDGVGLQMPKKPDARSILSITKDEWGGLPPALRGEMENVFKEEALPTRKTLIDRYYLSISTKSTKREK